MIKKNMFKNIAVFALILILNLSIALAQDSDKILVLNLNYNKASPTPLTLLEMAQSDGTAPAYHAEIGPGYKLNVMSKENILHTIKFKIPTDALSFQGLSKDVSGAKDNLNFALYLPYYTTATNIKIYDVSTGNLTLEIPLSVQSQIPNPENNSGYNLPNYSWMYIVGPIALILGLLVYVEVRRRKDHARLMINQRNNNAEALKNYVEKYIKKGYSKEQIRNALIKNNYNNQEIEEAFKGMK